MKEKTANQFRKWMEATGYYADPEDQIDDAILTLEWLVEKTQKESPHARSEIRWLEAAISSLETVKNEELYETETK